MRHAPTILWLTLAAAGCTVPHIGNLYEFSEADGCWELVGEQVEVGRLPRVHGCDDVMACYEAFDGQSWICTGTECGEPEGYHPYDGATPSEGYCDGDEPGG